MMSKLVVVPHNSSWSRMFDDEARAIRNTLGDVLLAVHHIGSTSIPGIYAKPVIDILVEVSDLAELDRRAGDMVGLGYEAKGEFGIVGRRYFRKDNSNGERTHQVHAFAVGSQEIVRHLGFRDHMLRNSADANAYSELKRKLAEQFPDDPQGYINGKDGFIKSIDNIVAQSNGCAR